MLKLAPPKNLEITPVNKSVGLRALFHLNFQAVQLSSVTVLLSIAHTVYAGEIFSSTDTATGQTKWSTQALDNSYQKTFTFAGSVDQSPVFKFLTKPSSQQALLYKKGLAFRPLVSSIASQHRVDIDLVMALIEVESGFNPHAVSPKGARGLMQLMPATASRYGMQDRKELLDPARNLDIGIRHLRDLLAIHNGQWALAMASYNAGQYAVAKHGQRIPRYNETMLYVPAVLSAAARQASSGTEHTQALSN